MDAKQQKKECIFSSFLQAQKIQHFVLCDSNCSILYLTLTHAPHSHYTCIVIYKFAEKKIKENRISLASIQAQQFFSFASEKITLVEW